MVVAKSLSWISMKRVRSRESGSLAMRATSTRLSRSLRRRGGRCGDSGRRAGAAGAAGVDRDVVRAELDGAAEAGGGREGSRIGVDAGDDPQGGVPLVGPEHEGVGGIRQDVEGASGGREPPVVDEGLRLDRGQLDAIEAGPARLERVQDRRRIQIVRRRDGQVRGSTSGSDADRGEAGRSISARNASSIGSPTPSPSASGLVT